jgi:hypothetical protein
VAVGRKAVEYCEEKALSNTVYRVFESFLVDIPTQQDKGEG